MLTYEKVIQMMENYNLPVALKNGLTLYGEYSSWDGKFMFIAKKDTNEIVSICFPQLGKEKMKRFLETMNRF